MFSLSKALATATIGLYFAMSGVADVSGGGLFDGGIKISKPRVPEFKPPIIKVPEIRVPNIKVPEFKVPKTDIPAPRIPMPKIPPLTTPRMPEIPKLPSPLRPPGLGRIKVPNIPMPNANIRMPHMPRLPQVSIHDIRRTGKNAREDVQREGVRLREKYPVGRAVEHWTSDQLYYAYRDFFLSQARRSTTAINLTPNGTHYQRLVASGVMPRDLELDSVELYFNASVPSGMAAITFGNRVLLKQSYDPEDPNLTLLLAHEAAHTVQYRRLGGEKQFARRYIGQIGQAVRRGQFLDMHDELELESEATEIDQAWSNWWDNTGRSLNFPSTSWH